MTWILILWISSKSVATAEFNTRLACELAVSRFEAEHARSDNHAICVEKGVKQ